MTIPESIIKARKTFEEYGKRAYELALAIISKERFGYAPVQEALLYFLRHCWRNYQHAALIALACESAGGSVDATTKVGASFVLLTGAADVHDDVIDQSRVKNEKLTVFEKYGKDMALLVGDALLFEGCMLLADACTEFPEKMRTKIQALVKYGFFELGCAEAEEASLRGRWNVSPEIYLDIMKRKAVIAETAMRLGAVIGHGSHELIKALGTYGRALAMLVNIRDEFVDVFEPEEMTNRIKNECLPLPLLYALRNKDLGNKLTSRLADGNASAQETSKLAQVVAAADEVQPLKNEVIRISQVARKSLHGVKKTETRTELQQLVDAVMEEMW